MLTNTNIDFNVISLSEYETVTTDVIFPNKESLAYYAINILSHGTSHSSQLEVFSSAADIVSGAYPMSSRPSSVRPSTFLKSNGLPQFSSDLSDVWLVVDNNIVQKVVQEKKFDFCL